MNDEALIAVKIGNLAKLKELLAQNINVNAQDANGRTLLHHAASSGQHDTVQYLLKHGADVMITTDKNNTVLHIAVMKDDSSMVETILKNVVRGKLRKLINIKTKISGAAALHVAAKNECYTNVSLLLEFGANFEITNNVDKKPVDLTNNQYIRELFMLINASFVKVKNGNDQLIDDLKNCNYAYFTPTLNCRNKKGYALIQVLVAKKREKLSRDLTSLRMFTPVPERDSENTYSYDRINEMEKLSEQMEKYRKFWSEDAGIRLAFAHVNKEFQTDITRYLKIVCQVLKKAHEIFLAYRKFSGEKSLTTNPLMKTVEEVLEVLGFDPDQLYINNNEEASYYHKVPIRWKEDFEAFMNVVVSIVHSHIELFSDKLKIIQLTFAVDDGNVMKVQNLLKNNTPTDHIDSKNRTVLSYAVEKGNKKIISLLLKAGIPVMQHDIKLLPNIPDNEIISPVYLAANTGQTEVVKLLLENIIDANDIPEFIDCQQVVKRTALHAAAEGGQLDIVKILLSYGATYDIFDAEGCTSLDVSKNDDVSTFFKIVDECFHDAKKANVKLIRKLKAMNNDELMAVTCTRNYEGNTLAAVATNAGAKNIATMILKKIKEAS